MVCYPIKNDFSSFEDGFGMSISNIAIIFKLFSKTEEKIIDIASFHPFLIIPWLHVCKVCPECARLVKHSSSSSNLALWTNYFSSFCLCASGAQ